MVHTPFTWCYGGSQVFLCGSFSGWSERVPMILVEGSSTIFQAIYDLPPGYHTFKFLVDGVWRVDERLLCAEDEYGVNNVILVKEPEVISPRLMVVAGQPVIDINNYGMTHYAASTSGGVHPELMLSISSTDIEVSRHRLSMHLSCCKIYDLIPNSGKVFALDAQVAVEDAFHVMHEQGLAVVPLWDEPSRQISGMLTASDFILILMELQRNRAMVTRQLLEMHTVSAWKEGKLHLHRRPLIQAGPDESHRDVAVRILQNKISAVPVLHLVEDSTCPQLLHVACLAGMLRHICRHFEHRPEYLPLLQQPVGSLLLGTWTREVGGVRDRQLLTLLPIDLLSSAFNLLIEAQISSIPVVDEKGALVNVFSRSDITSLAKGNVYVHIQLDHTRVSQALELVDDGTNARYRTCTRFDSLYRVMELLSDPAVRRLVVIDAGSQRVEGIITLRDIFSFILS